MQSQSNSVVIIRGDGDVIVLAESGEYNVDNPEQEEDASGNNTSHEGASELTLDSAATEDKNADSNQAAGQEEDDGEIKTLGRHFVLFIVLLAVDNGNGPGESKSEENVD